MNNDNLLEVLGIHDKEDVISNLLTYCFNNHEEFRNMFDEAVLKRFKDEREIAMWSRKALASAVKSGLISGYADGTLRPEDNITRSEVAVVIARALKADLKGKAELMFKDRDTIPFWAKSSIAWATDKGIIAGFPDRTFQGNRWATRAEICTILAKLVGIN